MYKKILLINPFGIGDVLFTTPIIHTLKDSFPGLKLGYLCNRRTSPLLENNPFVDSIFVYERDEFQNFRRQSFFIWLGKMIEFMSQLKKEHFDLAFDFSLNTQYGFFSWYAGIRMRIGYDFKKRGVFLTKKAALRGYDEKHIVEYYADLLKTLRLDLKYRNLELYLKEDDIKWAREILARQNLLESDFLVGIIPGAGASWGSTAYLKHWPAKNFARLADKIVESCRAKIIILGDFSERTVARELIQNMRSFALDLSGMTTLGQLTALLSKVGLAITNDGGPLHICTALGVKTVSIFGPVDPRVYGPYPLSQDHIVIAKNLPCQPCYKNFRFKGCSYNRKCIVDITIDEVFSAVKKLI